jgi:hypothetical protein
MESKMSDLIPEKYINAIAKAKKYANFFSNLLDSYLEEIYPSEDGKIIYVTLTIKIQCISIDRWLPKKVFIIDSEDMSLLGIRDYKLKEVFYD